MAKVRLLPLRSVAIDGRTVAEHEEVEVSDDDAVTLITEGFAQSTDEPADITDAG